jgi:DNA-binding GntR family transcriptional regulator
MSNRVRSPLLQNLVVDRRGGPQQTVVAELRRLILSGDAPPGTSVPLGDIADLFGVSHIPVREALKTLIGEGLVTHRPNSGYSVAQLTLQELYELYIVRESLEMAAQTHAIVRATEEDREVAKVANERMRQAIRDGDAGAIQRENRNFHIALARPSGMRRLLRMLEVAWNMIEPSQPLRRFDIADIERLNADHDEMLDAFLARDAVRLRALSERHAHSLNDVIVALPTDIVTGLLARED